MVRHGAVVVWYPAIVKAVHQHGLASGSVGAVAPRVDASGYGERRQSINDNISAILIRFDEIARVG
jgi:hypothetical protein